jgi:hypothetical protein
MRSSTARAFARRDSSTRSSSFAALMRHEPVTAVLDRLSGVAQLQEKLQTDDSRPNRS